MPDKRDYYEVLGVERDADARTIKRAFLKKAREVHPDVSDAPDAEERFKEVNEAYSVLSDETKRANYDRFGTAEPGGMGGSGYVDLNDIFGGMGVDDIFSSFFGGGAGSGRARAQRRQGRDMAISLTVTLREAATGCTKTIAYDRLAPCEDCHGTGVAEGGREKQCPRCHGTGYVTQVQRSIFGQVQSSAPCPDCHGEGKVVDKPCDMCNGEGRTPTHEKLDVNVPAGIASGRQLRVQGYGEAGFRGAASGDLIVSVQVADDDVFERRGDDLYREVRVSITQAALGCTVEVNGILPDERVQVKVPEGTQPGDTIAVEGRGMPRIGGGTQRGRLVACIAVDVPKKLSAHARELLEELADEMGDEVDRKKGTVGGRIREAIDEMLDERD